MKDVEPDTAPPVPLFQQDLSDELIAVEAKKSLEKQQRMDNNHQGGDARAPDFSEVLSKTVVDEES